MNSFHTPQKTDQGWVVDIPAELIQALGVAEGSQAMLDPNVLYAAKGNTPLAEMPAPDSYTLVPDGTPPGPPRNVAQAYARAVQAFGSGADFEVDFELAVTRHKLIDAIARSSSGERVDQL